MKYTYTNGFVTQTDYGNGLRRTATPDLDHGLPATTVTTNPQSQTLESTENFFSSAFQDRSSAIAGTSSEESFSTCCESRMDSTCHTYSEEGLPEYQSDCEQQLRWDAVSNLRRTFWREFLYNPEANRLDQIRDIAEPNTVRHTYGYDAAGFVTSRDGVALGYDATGAIASIGTVAAFDHDLNGRQISRTLNGVTKNFRFGGAIAYSTAGNPIELDLGEVVIKLDGTGTRYRHVDFRGNVLFQTNGAGNVTGQAVYRGFGRFTVNGTLGERGFAGGFEIPSLGVVVLGPRVLDGDAARFLSPDPLFNAVNQYAYAQGNPVFMWDPTGMSIDRWSLAGWVLWLWNPNIGVEGGWELLGGAPAWFQRGPDFGSGSINLGGWIGITGTVTIDRCGQTFVGFGPNVGKALTTGLSGSAVAGWLNQSSTPTQSQLQSFLSGHAFTAGAGQWGGGGAQYSPSTGGTASLAGFFTPQAGGGYTYSWQMGDNVSCP